MKSGSIKLKALFAVMFLSFILKGEDELAKYPFYTGYILPTPHKVEYKTGDMELYDISGKKPLTVIIAPDKTDVLIEDFSKRIEYMGGSLPLNPDDAGYENIILMGELGKNPKAKELIEKYNIPFPGKKESYILKLVKDSGKNYYIAAGHDKPGSYWAMQSMRQLLTQKDGKIVIETADVYDFPGFTNFRSYIIGAGRLSFLPLDYLMNFALIYKYNAVVIENALTKKPGLWREINQSEIEKMCKDYEFLQKRGIKIVQEISFCRGKPEEKIAISSAADMEKVDRLLESFFSKGIDVSILFDDVTFPMNPQDEAKYGKASLAHTELLNHLVKNVLSKYPEREIYFCPPFYMNPNQWLKLPEDHKEYLNYLRDNTSPGIILNWTGPMTTSSKVKPEDIDWWSKNTGKKIFYFDNAFHGGHSGQYDGWYYFETFDFAKRFPEKFRETYLYMMCTGGFWCGPAETLLANTSDYLWNPDAYKDPSESLRKSISQTIGPDCVELCLKWRKEICRFDPYVYRPNSAAARMLPEFMTWYGEMEKTVEEIKKRSENPYIPQVLGFFNGLIKKKLIDRAAKIKPESLPEKTEAGIALSPDAFRGGVGYKKHSEDCPERYACWTYGKEAGTQSALETLFELNKGDVAEDKILTLSIAGQNIPVTAGKKVNVKIIMNGNVVYEGPNKCVEHGWNEWEISFPRKYLNQPGRNTVRIENMEEAQPECFMISGIKLTGKKKAE